MKHTISDESGVLDQVKRFQQDPEGFLSGRVAIAPPIWWSDTHDAAYVAASGLTGDWFDDLIEGIERDRHSICEMIEVLLDRSGARPMSWLGSRRFRTSTDAMIQILGGKFGRASKISRVWSDAIWVEEQRLTVLHWSSCTRWAYPLALLANCHSHLAERLRVEYRRVFGGVGESRCKRQRRFTAPSIAFPAPPNSVSLDDDNDGSPRVVCSHTEFHPAAKKQQQTMLRG